MSENIFTDDPVLAAERSLYQALKQAFELDQENAVGIVADLGAQAAAYLADIAVVGVPGTVRQMAKDRLREMLDEISTLIDEVSQMEQSRDGAQT